MATGAYGHGIMYAGASMRRARMPQLTPVCPLAPPALGAAAMPALAWGQGRLMREVYLFDTVAQYLHGLSRSQFDNTLSGSLWYATCYRCMIQVQRMVQQTGA